MSRTCVIQYATGEEYTNQLAISGPINYEKAYRHNYDYKLYTHDAGKRGASWERVAIFKELLHSYDYLIWLDVDSVWYKDEPLLNAIPNMNFTFYLTKHNEDPIPHFNLGVMYIQVSSELEECLNIWDNTDDEGHVWWEQYSFLKCCKDPIFSLEVCEIPHRWNSLPHIHHYTSQDPVVVSWHGLPNRTQFMKEFLK